VVLFLFSVLETNQGSWVSGFKVFFKVEKLKPLCPQIFFLLPLPPNTHMPPFGNRRQLPGHKVIATAGGSLMQLSQVFSLSLGFILQRSCYYYAFEIFSSATFVFLFCFSCGTGV
jgi:hypothetical protein